MAREIAGPDHPAEREAEAVAARVMSMNVPAPVGPVQRMAEDISMRQPEEEEEEETLQLQEEEEDEEALQLQAEEDEEERIQPRAEPGGARAPRGNPMAGLGSGRPLPASACAFFEPRFGRSFADVHIHDGATAGARAREVNARAFTYGRNIVFNQGRYSPDSHAGRHLLAHELTHVVQQGAGAVRVQRLVEVMPDVAAAADILDQFDFLCPSGNFTLNGQRIESACTMNNQSCDCLCDVTTDASRAYSIEVHDVTDTPTSVTLHDGTTETVPMPSKAPKTSPGTHPTIDMPSSMGSALAFGAFRPDGSPFVADNWRILGHEICGHARLNQDYPGSKGDRPGHDVTIRTENAIAGEHGDPARGEDSDTRQGESFHSPPVGGAKLVFKLRDGWHHEHVP